MVSFYTPWKHQKTASFVIFSGGIDRDHPANISTLFQCCLLVDTTSRRGTTSNQRWNNAMYFNVGINNIEQYRINVVYFNVDMNNVRQHRNNVVIFNVKFHNVGKRGNNVVKTSFSEKNKKNSNKKFK